MMLRFFSSKKPALPHANKALSQPIRSWLTMPVAMSTCLPASVHQIWRKPSFRACLAQNMIFAYLALS